MRDRREEKDGGSFESMKEDACASAYCQNGSVCVDKKGDEKKKKKNARGGRQRGEWKTTRRFSLLLIARSAEVLQKDIESPTGSAVPSTS